ncbi:MAG: HNH endonuclease signature motif containing protein [Gemmatimonadota bacterium]
MSTRRRDGDADDRRQRIFRRDDFTCVYCGQRFDVDDLTVDHVEPRVKGGDNSAGNLVTACTACNTEKGGAPAWAYLAGRPEKRANFLRLAVRVWPRLRRAIDEAARDG